MKRELETKGQSFQDRSSFTELFSGYDCFWSSKLRPIGKHGPFALKHSPYLNETALDVAGGESSSIKSKPQSPEFGPWLPETQEAPLLAGTVKGLSFLPKNGQEFCFLKYSLLWEELLGFPMYLRMGFRFLSSKASFSFLELLLCWDRRH